jgi:hypothetical protein
VSPASEDRGQLLGALTRKREGRNRVALAQVFRVEEKVTGSKGGDGKGSRHMGTDCWGRWWRWKEITLVFPWILSVIVKHCRAEQRGPNIPPGTGEPSVQQSGTRMLKCRSCQNNDQQECIDRRVGGIGQGR